MKAVISYRHTGADMVELGSLLTVTRDALRRKGIDPYCLFFEKLAGRQKQLPPADMLQRAFREIDTADALFVVQASEMRSEGMLMEAGYAKARGVSLIVATHASVAATYLPDMADRSIRYRSLAELDENIGALDLSGLTSDDYLIENPKLNFSRLV